MPDPAPRKRRYRPGESAPPKGLAGEASRSSGRLAQRRDGSGYAELHCRTNYSFLEGASHPDELVHRAAELGYAALAVTDHHSLAGVVQAHVAAKEAGLPLLIGAEIRPLDAPPLVLLATDRAAYGRLARLLTRGRRRAAKGQCRLVWDDVAEHAEGLIAGIFDASHEPLPAPREVAAAEPAASWLALRAAATPAALERLWSRHLAAYRERFGDRCYLLAELVCGPNDAGYLERLIARSRASGVPLAAAGDVHYHAPERQALHDVLTAIRRGTTVAEAGLWRLANAERHLQSRAAIEARFAALPAAVARTVEIAARCRFSLDELRYEYPEELCPPGLTPGEHLARLVWRGARRRYPEGIDARVRQQLEHELTLIAELEYEAYFLTVWDLVRFARRRGILCQGRGSAANSVVCYCLGVTSVDPVRMELLFERFVSRERNEAPDIDVDFEHERREEVLQYVYEKYGRDRAGMTAEVISYRPRSAIRDVGRALGLAADRIDALTRSSDGYGGDVAQLPERCREAGLDPETPLGRQLQSLVGQLLGFPRHLSQHVGGMVITRGPLCELVPIENAAMPGRTVIEWDKDDLDDLGILKVDCLALGMLTAIHRAFDLVERHAGRRWTLASVPAEDPAVYEMVGRADTVGVFQIESRAQMSMLPRLKPRSFYDLVIEVALVRPGPIQGDMVHPYLRRRAGLEPVVYPSDEIRAVLEKTLGVPIFQEQAMRLAVVAAGFTPGEADQLRRAMGAWRRVGVIEGFREKLLSGMQSRGLPAEFAQRVFEQIRGFGEYGFPESHAASFALLVYVSAWLKRHYPAAFTAALLNSQPMGFYAPAQLVRDAREHGVEVRPVDVNHSAWDATLEPRPAVRPEQRWALRLGLRTIRGLPAAEGAAIERARSEGPFNSLDELARRSGLGRAALKRLAAADALRSLALERRTGLWQALAHEKPLPLWSEEDEPPLELPPLSPVEEVVADYQTAGLSLRNHPLSFLRGQLDERRVVPAAALVRLRDGRRVRVAGLVLLRQRPSSASGVTFVTLEDETGQANLVVYPGTWQRFHAVASRASVLLASGRLERQESIVHVLVERLEDAGHLLAELRTRSRDFR